MPIFKTENQDGNEAMMAVMGTGDIIQTAFIDNLNGRIVCGLRLFQGNTIRKPRQKILESDLSEEESKTTPKIVFTFLQDSDVDGLIATLNKIKEIKKDYETLLIYKKDAENNIGEKVFKISGKPFKSGNKINTVKEVVIHPVLKNKLTYTFQEDESYVECHKCELSKN